VCDEVEVSTIKCTVPLCRWSVEWPVIYDDMEALRINTKLNHIQNLHPVVWSLIETRAWYRRVKKAMHK
jgi:hypothetical protein